MLSDLRAALRALRSRPGFSLVATLALALGTGAALLVFSVVDAVLLRALPYERAEQVIIPRSANRTEKVQGNPLSWGEYAALRTLPGVFAASGAVYFEYPDLTGVAEPAQLILGRVTGAFFRAAGVRPMLGRAFSAEEIAADAPVVMLDEARWRRHFAGDPAILGRTITLDREPLTVVGIMPTVRLGWQEFHGWRPADPAVVRAATFAPRTVTVVARVRDGIAPAAASRAIAAIGARLALEHPKESRGWTLGAVTLRDLEVGDQRTALLVLLGATGLVLLVACANVAHLLLARGEERRRETAIRAALGASRGRLVRQALLESMLLAGTGSVAGLTLARALRPVILELSPLTAAQREAVAFDGRVIAVAVLAALVTGVLFGLVPALRNGRADAQEALRAGGRGTTGRGVWRSRGALVVSEVALACVLLVGATLLARSFAGLARIDRGYDPVGVGRAGIVLPDYQYPTDASRREFVRAVEAQLLATPGVTAAGLANFPPNYGGIPARVQVANGEPVPVSSRVATPGFFAALRIPLVSGRLFDATDDAKAPQVAVISASLARRAFGTEPPIGRELSLASWGPEPTVLRVVGVVGDVRQSGRRADLGVDVWQPYSQVAFSYANLMVRGEGVPTDQLVGALRRAVLAADPARPIFDFGSMEERSGTDVQAERFAAALMGAFALVAALLAAVGVAGVMALAVAARTREIGIRVALGGTPAEVMRHVVRPGLTLVLVGAVTGGVLALGGSRLLASQLYGIAPRDPTVFAGVLLAITLVGAAACWLPARRASRVDPLVALRAD